MTERNIEEALAALDIQMVDQFKDAVDQGADIVNATRMMAHNLLIIRKAHLNEADRLFEIVKNLAESAQISAELIADTISAEWGITETEFFEDEDDEEEEDDE